MFVFGFGCHMKFSPFMFSLPPYKWYAGRDDLHSFSSMVQGRGEQRLTDFLAMVIHVSCADY
ncbi:hypothetical protein GSVR_36790 [Geobacter sp. SVR]|nr:hypothetical protein GSVR_36790 [Geobacter sp. SVR]